MTEDAHSHDTSRNAETFAAMLDDDAGATDIAGQHEREAPICPPAPDSRIVHDDAPAVSTAYVFAQMMEGRLFRPGR